MSELALEASRLIYNRSGFVLIPVTFTLFLLSCDDDTIPAEYSYTIHEGKEIVLTQEIFEPDSTIHYLYEIQDGNSLVFEYEYIAERSKSAEDDYFAERVMFEISPGSESFLYRDAIIKNSKCFYNQECFGCPIYENEAIIAVEGELEGQKVGDGVWEVRISISAESQREIFSVNLSHVFRRKN